MLMYTYALWTHARMRTSSLLEEEDELVQNQVAQAFARDAWDVAETEAGHDHGATILGRGKNTGGSW